MRNWQRLAAWVVPIHHATVYGEEQADGSVQNVFIAWWQWNWRRRVFGVQRFVVN